jgi:hypothetical protein
MMTNEPESAPSPVLASTHVRFLDVPDSAQIRAQIEAFLLKVSGKSKIDSANFAFSHHATLSPSYTAALHLAVPGPDMRLEHRGATLLEAWQKLTADVLKRLRLRDTRRASSRKRTEPRRMAA